MFPELVQLQLGRLNFVLGPHVLDAKADGLQVPHFSRPGL